MINVVMTEKEIEKLAMLIVEKIVAQRTIDSASHAAHHQFVEELIKDYENRSTRHEQWIRIIGGWGIIAVLGGLAAAVWHYFLSKVN